MQNLVFTEQDGRKRMVAVPDEAFYDEDSAGVSTYDEDSARVSTKRHRLYELFTESLPSMDEQTIDRLLEILE